MAKTYNKMIIDMNSGIHSAVTAVAQDTMSRYLDCSLYNNGITLDLTGHMAQLYITKKDGTIVVTHGEIKDAAAGRVQFELTNQALAVSGDLDLQIVLTSSAGEVLSSEIFKLHVLPSIRNDEAIESTNEFGALVVLFQEIQNSLDLMSAIVDSFGEPGEKAAEYGADTFWGILEVLAGRADVETVLKKYLEKYIKDAVNSAFGTDNIMPLDQMIKSLLGGFQEYSSPGEYTFTVPTGVTLIAITACGGGGGAGGAGGYNSGIKGGGGNGGNAGEVVRSLIAQVNPGDVITIKVGAGGNVGSDGGYKEKGGNGTNGEATVIESIVTLQGGTGGLGGVSGANVAGSKAQINGFYSLFGDGGKAGGIDQGGSEGHSGFVYIAFGIISAIEAAL